MIDHRVWYQLHSTEHIDYLIDLNAMEMRMQHKNIDRVHYMIDMIRDKFYMFASLDHKIVSLNIPYKDHRQAYNVPGMLYMLMGQLLF